MIDERKLQEVGARFGEAVVDPRHWPDLMQDICAAVGAAGAAMLQSDIRTEDIPRTPSINGFFDKVYFPAKLHISDVRAARGVPLLLTKTNVVTDADLFRSEPEMLRDPLYLHLGEWGLKWFAAIGFRAGSALWGLTIQRSPHEGMFAEEEITALSRLSARLTEAATLSTSVGRSALTGITNALELSDRPALSLDRLGRLISINRKAEGYLGNELLLRGDRIVLADKHANAELGQLLDHVRIGSDKQAFNAPAIILRRSAPRRPIVLQALSVPSAAQSPFLGARLVLVLRDIDGEPVLDPHLLNRLFGLTTAQTRVAVKLASGFSLEQAASELGVSMETARQHLKAIFTKTDTHRQGELVALLGKISGA